MKPTLIINYKIISITLLCLLNHHLISQQRVYRMKKYEKGAITSLLQDKYGYLWIGGYGGLQKFDGTNFLSYNYSNADTTTIIDSKINCLFEDHNDNIWVGTQYGLCVFNRKTNNFKRFYNTANDSVSIALTNIVDITSGLDSNVYIISNSSIFKYDKKINLLYNLKINKEGISYFTSIESYSKDTLLLGSSNGLYYLTSSNKISSELTKYQFKSDIYNATIKDKQVNSIDHLNGTTLITYDKYIYDLNKNTLITVTIEGPLFKALPFNNSIWLLSDVGLYKYNLDNHILDTVARQGIYPWDLLSDPLFCGIFDKENNFWIGSSSGLHKIQHNLIMESVISIHLDHSQDNHMPYYIHSQFQINDSIVITWLANSLQLFNLNHMNFFKYKLHSNNIQRFVNNTIVCFSNDTEGNIWLGGDNGITVLRNGSVNANLMNALSKYQDKLNYIRDIFVDINNDVWVGRWPGGLFKYNSKTNSLKTYLDQTQIRKIYQDNKGIIWIGTRRGLYKYISSQDTFIQYRHDRYNKSSMPENTAFDIYRSNDSTLWVATYGGGIAALNISNDRFLTFSSAHGLINDNVLGIIPDKNEFLWLTTFEGLSVFRLSDSSFINYNFEDGLLNTSYAPFSSSKLSGDSLIIVKGNFGWDIINIKRFINSNKNIIDIYIDNIELNYDKKINVYNNTTFFKLKYDENNIKFNYTGVNLSNASNIKYEYRLLGFNNTWAQNGKNSSITFTNLKHGSYDLEIRPVGQAIDSSDHKLIVFEIAKAPYLTNFAKFLYLLIFSALSVFMFKAYKQRLLRRSRRKEELLKLEHAKEIGVAYEQLKVTQDQLIQSEKLAFLGEITAGIAHELKNPLNFIKNFTEINREIIYEISEKVKDDQEDLNLVINNIDTILNHSKRADDIISSMLLHSRKNKVEREYIDVEKIAEESLSIFQGLDDEFISSVRFKTDFGHYNTTLLADNNDLTRVFISLLNNSLYALKEKSSKTSEFIPFILVKSVLRETNLIINIIDNGSGIDPQYEKKIFQPFFTTKPTGKGVGLGLSIAYDIMKNSVGGDLKLCNSNEGANFELHFPVSRNR